MNELTTSIDETIKTKIYTIRGLQVMLDRDLAELYGVETKVFNQAVKRNEDRFPSDFRFQLTAIEKNELVTNCDRLIGMSLKDLGKKWFAFSKFGIEALSIMGKLK